MAGVEAQLTNEFALGAAVTIAERVNGVEFAQVVRGAIGELCGIGVLKVLLYSELVEGFVRTETICS